MSSQVRSDLASIDSVVGSAFDPFGGAANAFAGVSGGKLTVNHDTVLQAGKVIQDQVDQLKMLVVPKAKSLKMTKFAEDFISLDVADEWNKLLDQNPDSYKNRIMQYVDSLEKLAGQLKTAAKQYGYTEDQIKAAFGASE
ncbi:hypothetical protein KALB_8584 [Kutzneria albida DSM 43870]|uniref:PE domain-containing protein n=2 Tax=Kutzneria TaxID=43356 RepID=W5WMD1_9PSEU|nr:hypothetical protein KALB_8584 [Kutzneria albida DSM 43870]